jgi:hypothetical protein
LIRRSSTRCLSTGAPATQVFFFHLLVNLETDLASVQWTTYRARRPFLAFPGAFHERGPGRRVARAAGRALCLADTACLGLLLRSNSSAALTLDYLDMDSFSPLPDTVTLVRTDPRGGGLVGSSAWDLASLDLCCPATPEGSGPRGPPADSLERVPCSIHPAEFHARFVSRGEPVVLAGCASSWPALAWRLPTVLGAGAGTRLWRTDWRERRAGGLLEAWGAKELLPGRRVAAILANNGTARVFHSLGRRSRDPAGAPLLADYSPPPALPRDLYKVTAGLK